MKDLAELLKQNNLKIIFAESCTAGAASSTLALVPGISNHLCGSYVTYTAQQKINALSVPQQMIQEFTTESKEVAEWMAKEAYFLAKFANWAVSIVGHFGPQAPPEKDGKIWVSIFGSKNGEYVRNNEIIQLQSTSREDRMKEAVQELFQFCVRNIES